MEFHETLFEICNSLTKGNYLVASRDIAPSELIFFNAPKFWKPHFKGEQTTTLPFCHECGLMASEESSAFIPCGPTSCACNFCSAECKEKSAGKGHRWICPGTALADDLNILEIIDGPVGHIGLGAKVYAEAAALSFSHPDKTPEEIFVKLLGGFHSVDHCLTTHAVRTGTIEVDEDMFKSLIGPAYFASTLEAALLHIKRLIIYNHCVWGPDGESLRLKFEESSVFTEAFFRRFMGTFMVNNLTVELKLPPGDPAEPVKGTGLYEVYAMMNHSCECNTANAFTHRGEVHVFARRSIAAGEEITTSYLHVADPAALTRRKRARLLAQYLFRCECRLCEEQARLEGSDDDDDDD